MAIVFFSILVDSLLPVLRQGVCMTLHSVVTSYQAHHVPLKDCLFWVWGKVTTYSS